MQKCEININFDTAQSFYIIIIEYIAKKILHKYLNIYAINSILLSQQIFLFLENHGAREVTT